MATASAAPRTDLDLDAFRRVLEEERDRLLSELKELSAEARQGEPGIANELSGIDQHDAEHATELFMREQDDAIAQGLRVELAQVENAFGKLDAGTYGICDRCGTRIPKARLEALPFALVCIRCADDLEARV